VKRGDEECSGYQMMLKRDGEEMFQRPRGKDEIMEVSCFIFPPIFIILLPKWIRKGVRCFG
jgi:hypothetical protein